jgi:tryptophan synthase alpha chain
MHSLVDGGADLIELGIPFSDPMADGPVIQASSERAISRGVGLAQVLEWVREFRSSDSDTPLVLMGYMNPFERYGYDSLAAETADAGVDGLLLVDCPPEEMQGIQQALDKRGVYSIRLVAPTTTGERMVSLAASARGFIYYVSFKGTTGAGKLAAEAVSGPIEQIRRHSDLPVAVGFGIRDPQSAKAVARFSDGIVIGSALVEQLSGCAGLEDACGCARNFMASIRRALDSLAGEAA